MHTDLNFGCKLVSTSASQPFILLTGWWLVNTFHSMYQVGI